MTDETPTPAPEAPTTPPAPAPVTAPEPVQAPPAADAPETLVAREGLGEGLVSKVGEIAKAEKVSVSAAQKMLDAAAESHSAAIKAQQESWREAAINDPDIGGDKLSETTTRANQFVETFGSPALREILVQTKLNEHPEFLRLFAEAHKAVSPDRLAVGRPAGTRSSRDMSFSAIAERMYRKS